MAYAIIDKSRHPIVVVEFGENEPSEQEFDNYLKSIFDFYTKNKGVVVVYDLRKPTYVSNRLRIKMGKWLKDNLDLVNSSVYGVTYVVPRFLQRSLLKAVFVVQKPIWAHQIFATFDDAIAWAEEKIDHHK